jgi:hypothetical protein
MFQIGVDLTIHLAKFNLLLIFKINVMPILSYLSWNNLFSCLFFFLFKYNENRFIFERKVRVAFGIGFIHIHNLFHDW